MLVDLAVAMGIPDDELTKDRTAVRRHSIRAKLKRPRTVQFSLVSKTIADNLSEVMWSDDMWCDVVWCDVHDVVW